MLQQICNPIIKVETSDIASKLSFEFKTINTRTLCIEDNVEIDNFGATLNIQHYNKLHAKFTLRLENGVL